MRRCRALPRIPLPSSPGWLGLCEPSWKCKMSHKVMEYSSISKILTILNSMNICGVSIFLLCILNSCPPFNGKITKYKNSYKKSINFFLNKFLFWSASPYSKNHKASSLVNKVVGRTQVTICVICSNIDVIFWANVWSKITTHDTKRNIHQQFKVETTVHCLSLFQK